MIVVTMEKIFGSVLKHQARGEMWLLFEATLNIVKIYVEFSG